MIDLLIRVGPSKGHGCGGSEKCKQCYPDKPEEKYKPSLEEQVRCLVDLVESDRDSSQEWKTLRGFYADLLKKKETDQIRNLKNMIKPVLAKYGYHL
jgi:hypothetical protein